MSRVKRTIIAQAGFDFAAEFAMRFAQIRLTGRVEFLPTLAAPELDSTGGGKQAMQHLVLKPTVAGEPSITVGWVNLKERQAQLRTFACLEQMHAARFPGRPFSLEASVYEGFFRTAQAFFTMNGLNVTIQQAPPLKSERPPAAGAGVFAGRLLVYGCAIPAALLTMVVVALAYVYFYQRPLLAPVLGALGVQP